MGKYGWKIWDGKQWIKILGGSFRDPRGSLKTRAQFYVTPTYCFSKDTSILQPDCLYSRLCVCACLCLYVYMYVCMYVCIYAQKSCAPNSLQHVQHGGGNYVQGKHYFVAYRNKWKLKSKSKYIFIVQVSPEVQRTVHHLPPGLGTHSFTVSSSWGESNTFLQPYSAASWPRTNAHFNDQVVLQYVLQMLLMIRTIARN